MSGDHNLYQKDKSFLDEPIAWATDLEFDEQTKIIHSAEKKRNRYQAYNIPLFVTPFEWRGLSDKDYEELSKFAHIEVIQKIETILRDRNS